MPDILCVQSIFLPVLRSVLRQIQWRERNAIVQLHIITIWGCHTCFIWTGMHQLRKRQWFVLTQNIWALLYSNKVSTLSPFVSTNNFCTCKQEAGSSRHMQDGVRVAPKRLLPVQNGCCGLLIVLMCLSVWPRRCPCLWIMYLGCVDVARSCCSLLLLGQVHRPLPLLCCHGSEEACSTPSLHVSLSVLSSGAPVERFSIVCLSDVGYADCIVFSVMLSWLTIPLTNLWLLFPLSLFFC